MELSLISGRFTKKDATEILNDIFQVKIAFHEKKIQSSEMNEEDIAHAESRIRELQHTLSRIHQRIRNNPDDLVDVHAHIDISMHPYLTQ